MTESSSPVAVIVLAAGAGTRMKSKTPKILHTIAGRSLIGHVLHATAGIQPAHVVAVVSHDGERVSAAIDAVAAELELQYEIAWQDTPRGTGDAARVGLAALPSDFEGTVIVTAADVPLLNADVLGGLIATHCGDRDGDRDGDAQGGSEASGSDRHIATVTLTSFLAHDPTGYGRIIRTNDGSVQAIVEEKDATDKQRAITEVNAGVYAFDAATLRTALAGLSTNNSQGEFYLTDVVAIARRDGGTVRGFTVADRNLVAGCNDRVQLSDLAAEFNRRIVRRHQLAGVTIVDPASTWIDVDVTIETDVRIESGTQLFGRTHVAEDAVIGPDTTLTDVSVGAGAQVIRTHGSDAVIGKDAVVGPFAYLRPSTVLGADSKIGTFVETKNSTIGAGSKIPHLTYVGDATIGEHSNVGASSVFVNYDGVRKHRTVIGSHCRTGSDNMFVAPVTVGDGAYTGAGTVVRQDVPPGALAVSAGEQRNVDDWVLRKRPNTAAADAARLAQHGTTQQQSEQIE